MSEYSFDRIRLMRSLHENPTLEEYGFSDITIQKKTETGFTEKTSDSAEKTSGPAEKTSDSAEKTSGFTEKSSGFTEKPSFVQKQETVKPDLNKIKTKMNAAKAILICTGILVTVTALVLVLRANTGVSASAGTTAILFAYMLPSVVGLILVSFVKVSGYILLAIGDIICSFFFLLSSGLLSGGNDDEMILILTLLILIWPVLHLILFLIMRKCKRQLMEQNGTAAVK